MIATDLANAALLLLIPLAWWVELLTLAMVLIVFVFVLTTLMNNAASQAFLPHLVPRGACAGMLMPGWTAPSAVGVPARRLAVWTHVRFAGQAVLDAVFAVYLLTMLELSYLWFGS